MVARHRVARGQFCAIGGHVDELVPSRYIARRVNAWNRRFEVVIDDDSTITGKHYAALLQPKPVAIGSASGGDEHLFRRDGVTMPLAGQFDPALCLGDTLIADTCANPHALGFQIVFQRGTHFRVHFGEQAASAADGDINAQTRKHLSQFYPDHPATDHQQRFGQAIQRQRRCAG